ncbi:MULTISPECIES: hypothetical protein [unclassified Streptomyces]|uniref:hypothetical protein n=1 Tax=unclassified Streptomyces TaxID=2593676 RepID=UPI00036770F7|nr:hypothetical protein [Streptomyces sp. BoleA5]MYX36723.1 hypothetical protein [Streptomyces sp. SID8377]
MKWARLLEEWALIEADLHEIYGIDIGAPGILTGRSWRWLRLRVYGLLSADSRISRVLNPPPEPKKHRKR